MCVCASNILLTPMIQGGRGVLDKLDSLSVDVQNFINDRVASWRERLLDYMMDLSKGDGVTYEDFRGNMPPHIRGFGRRLGRRKKGRALFSPFWACIPDERSL